MAGLDLHLDVRERSDVRITLEGEPKTVVLPDVLFATAADEWMKRPRFRGFPT